MRKNKKLETLADLLQKTETKAEFNIVEDLKSLERMYGVLKPRQYRQKLQVIIKKYEESELTAVRIAVLNESIKGNMQAVRLYAEYFKPADVIAEDDGLVTAIINKGKEVFK